MIKDVVFLRSCERHGREELCWKGGVGNPAITVDSKSIDVS